MDDRVGKILHNVERAQKAYDYYLGVKDKALLTKAKMVPIVDSMKQGLDIGRGIGKVINDEVTRNDVKWVFNQAQRRVFRRFERAVQHAKQASSQSKTKTHGE